jgi:hypothetical protein
MDLSNRDRYLDLMTKILTNMIYGDAPNDHWNTGPFQSNLRSEGQDWPAVAHTMVGVKRLANVRNLAQRALDEAIPGDFIETGIWRGGCCIMMRAVLAANGVRDRKVYGCDSFEGLPPPNPELYPSDEGLDLSVYKQLAAGLDDVKENFRKYDLLDDQVVFVKGYFEKTLPSLDAGPFALLRLDGDLYESTYLALQHLYPKVSPGGFVIIDDYEVLPQCKRAVQDYREQFGITDPVYPIDWSGVWWQKGGGANTRPEISGKSFRARLRKARNHLATKLSPQVRLEKTP